MGKNHGKPSTTKRTPPKKTRRGHGKSNRVSLEKEPLPTTAKRDETTDLPSATEDLVLSPDTSMEMSPIRTLDYHFDIDDEFPDTIDDEFVKKWMEQSHRLILDPSLTPRDKQILANKISTRKQELQAARDSKQVSHPRSESVEVERAQDTDTPSGTAGTMNESTIAEPPQRKSYFTAAINRVGQYLTGRPSDIDTANGQISDLATFPNRDLPRLEEEKSPYFHPDGWTRVQLVLNKPSNPTEQKMFLRYKACAEIIVEQGFILGPSSEADRKAVPLTADNIGTEWPLTSAGVRDMYFLHRFGYSLTDKRDDRIVLRLRLSDPNETFTAPIFDRRFKRQLNNLLTEHKGYMHSCAINCDHTVRLAWFAGSSRGMNADEILGEIMVSLDAYYFSLRWEQVRNEDDKWQPDPSLRASSAHALVLTADRDRLTKEDKDGLLEMFRSKATLLGLRLRLVPLAIMCEGAYSSTIAAKCATLKTQQFFLSFIPNKDSAEHLKDFQCLIAHKSTADIVHLDAQIPGIHRTLRELLLLLKVTIEVQGVMKQVPLFEFVSPRDRNSSLVNLGYMRDARQQLAEQYVAAPLILLLQHFDDPTDQINLKKCFTAQAQLESLTSKWDRDAGMIRNAATQHLDTLDLSEEYTGLEGLMAQHQALLPAPQEATEVIENITLVDTSRIATGERSVLADAKTIGSVESIFHYEQNRVEARENKKKVTSLRAQLANRNMEYDNLTSEMDHLKSMLAAQGIDPDHALKEQAAARVQEQQRREDTPTVSYHEA